MANKTKAEMLNEIDRLRDEMHASSDVLDEKSIEIKALHDCTALDDATINQKTNEIKELERKLKIFSDGITMRDEWHDDFTNEIKDLREQIELDANVKREMRKEIKTFELVCSAKANKIKDLDDALKIVRNLRSENVMEISRLDKAVAELGRIIGEKDNEIKLLDDENESLSAIIDKNRNDYNELNDLRNGSARRSAEKSKEIKRLDDVVCSYADGTQQNDHENGQLQQELATSRDYSDKQADVIRNYLNQIGELERRLDLAERFSNYKEFHNATVAMGNPQYFQRVSND